jgi:branched-chain amino acid transport system ATP-binding protein
MERTAMGDDEKVIKPLLEVDRVSVRFGGVVALDGVSFDLSRGQICGLIGPNGAGKTTLFNCVSRFYRCSGGRIVFDGKVLTDMPGYRMAALGISRTFQNLALFDSLSVRDNVIIGRHTQCRSGFLANALNLRRARREDADLRRHADELIDLLELGFVADRQVTELPFGLRKRVELARALASTPRLLLLDEPASGLNHEEIGVLSLLIRQIRDRLRISVLLVEHHMGLVMGVSDKVVALNFGRKIAEGTPAQVRGHADVIQAYLGAPA